MSDLVRRQIQAVAWELRCSEREAARLVGIVNQAAKDVAREAGNVHDDAPGRARLGPCQLLKLVPCGVLSSTQPSDSRFGVEVRTVQVYLHER